MGGRLVIGLRIAEILETGFCFTEEDEYEKAGR